MLAYFLKKFAQANEVLYYPISGFRKLLFKMIGNATNWIYQVTTNTYSQIVLTWCIFVAVVRVYVL